MYSVARARIQSNRLSFLNEFQQVAPFDPVPCLKRLQGTI
jgi:hypothetical protein